MAIVEWIVEHVDTTYRKGNWAGTGVLPALEGLTAEEAAWRPNPAQKSAGEMIRHMAYWKDAVTVRISGMPWSYDEEQDWRPVPPTTKGLQEAHAELAASHEALLAALGALRPERLFEQLGKAWWLEDAPAKVIDFALGAAQHDMYHAAQIFVLRRAYKEQHS